MFESIAKHVGKIRALSPFSITGFCTLVAKLTVNFNNSQFGSYLIHCLIYPQSKEMSKISIIKCSK